MWSPPSARGHLPSGSANGEARLTSAPPPPPRRAYLVTPDWLTQSLANSEIVDEIDYSIKGVFPDSTVTPRDINKRVRHCPPRQVLMGKSVCTRRAFKGMPQDELAMIVEAAGATLLGSMPSAGDLPPGCIVIGDPGHKLTRSAGASDAMAVDIQWLRNPVLAVVVCQSTSRRGRGISGFCIVSAPCFSQGLRQESCTCCRETDTASVLLH